MKVAVIGSGSWGTALAMVLARADHSVVMWARESQVVFDINQRHQNPEYLPGVTLPDTITANAELDEVISDVEMIVFATPSHALREVAAKVKPRLSGSEIIVCVSKGVEQDTFMTLSQVLVDVLEPVIPEDQVGVLLGPSHAEEVSRFKPTAIVAAAYSRSTAKKIQAAFLTPMFRVYVNHDIIGVEIAAAVKNVIAIAAGIVDGAEFGDNAKAALITRGLIEIRRLGLRLGASQDTIFGLSGIGDLIVTCTSTHSRNRYVGFHIGKGEKYKDIIARMNMVAEGIKATASVWGLAHKLGVEMPITEAVHKVLFDEYDPKEALYELMTRDAKDEIVN